MNGHAWILCGENKFAPVQTNWCYLKSCTCKLLRPVWMLLILVNPDGQNFQIIIKYSQFSGSFWKLWHDSWLLRNRLDQMIELRHSLAALANRMHWQEVEASQAQCWVRQIKVGKIYRAHIQGESIFSIALCPKFFKSKKFVKVLRMWSHYE